MNKNDLLKVFPFSFYKQYRKRIQDQKLYDKRKSYIPIIKKYIDQDTSIISSNCIAGRIMQDLKMQYNSPTLGLYFWYPDYIQFLSNLKYYLTESKLTFVETSKYPIGNERRAKKDYYYPIGLLDENIEIQFLHYHSKEEAYEKWHRRAERINWDKLFIIGSEQNLCSISDQESFNNLPFYNKVFFSSHKISTLESNCYLKEFDGMNVVGDPYKQADIFYRALAEFLETN